MFFINPLITAFQDEESASQFKNLKVLLIALLLYIAQLVKNSGQGLMSDIKELSCMLLMQYRVRLANA